MQVEGHQVRLRTLATGARVRNAYATYPLQGDSPGKPGLIPHGIFEWHRLMIKVPISIGMVKDGHASD